MSSDNNTLSLQRGRMGPTEPVANGINSWTNLIVFKEDDESTGCVDVEETLNQLRAIGPPTDIREAAEGLRQAGPWQEVDDALDLLHGLVMDNETYTKCL